MESSLPFALRVAAGLVSEAVGVVRRLPTEISALPVTVIGQAAKLSFQLNQQLTDLATSGDHLLAILHRPDAAPERTAWSTIDDEDEVAANDPQAAATWDTVRDAVDDAVNDAVDDTRAGTRAGTLAGTLDSTEPPAPSVGAGGGSSVPATAAPDSMERALVSDVEELEGQRPAPVLVGLPSQNGDPGTSADLGTLTIAQLRSRIRSMPVQQVRAALEHEQSNRARPAFLTVLTNRLSTLARGGE